MNLLRKLWRRFLEFLASPFFFRVVFGPLYWFKSQPNFDLRQRNYSGRILLARYDGLGDWICTTGFVRELRSSLPEAWITILVREEFRDFVSRCPYVNEVIGYKIQRHSRFSTLRSIWASVAFGQNELRRRRFQIALVPQQHFSFFDIRSMMYAAGIPCRVGWAGLKWPFNQHVPIPAAEHEVDRLYSWISSLGGTVEKKDLELWLKPEDRQRMRQRSEGLLAKAGKVIALGIGASQRNRIWPMTRFIELGRWLITKYNAALVVIAGEDMKVEAAMLEEALPGSVWNCAGVLVLAETGALLEQCDLFIGNDSGPMHLAAAAGIPVVEVSGLPSNAPAQHPSSPLRIGPYSQRVRIVQPGPQSDLEIDMQLVSIEAAQKAVQELL